MFVHKILSINSVYVYQVHGRWLLRYLFARHQRRDVSRVLEEGANVIVSAFRIVDILSEK